MYKTSCPITECWDAYGAAAPYQTACMLPHVDLWHSSVCVCDTRPDRTMAVAGFFEWPSLSGALPQSRAMPCRPSEASLSPASQGRREIEEIKARMGKKANKKYIVKFLSSAAGPCPQLFYSFAQTFPSIAPP